jgi:hypothetical protein
MSQDEDDDNPTFRTFGETDPTWSEWWGDDEPPTPDWMID